MPKTEPSESTEVPAKNLRRSIRIKNAMSLAACTSSTTSFLPVEMPRRKPKTPFERSPVASESSEQGRTSTGETTTRTGERKRATERTASPQEKTGRGKRIRTDNKDEKSSTSSIDADEEHASTADKDSDESSLDYEKGLDVEKEIERVDEKTVTVEDDVAVELASLLATLSEPSIPTTVALTTAQATSIVDDDNDEAHNESSLSMIVNLSSDKESASMVNELKHSVDTKPKTSFNQAMSATVENAAAQLQDKTESESIVKEPDDKQPPENKVILPSVESTNESRND